MSEERVACQSLYRRIVGLVVKCDSDLGISMLGRQNFSPNVFRDSDLIRYWIHLQPGNWYERGFLRSQCGLWRHFHRDRSNKRVVEVAIWQYGRVSFLSCVRYRVLATHPTNNVSLSLRTSDRVILSCGRSLTTLWQTTMTRTKATASTRRPQASLQSTKRRELVVLCTRQV